MTDALKAREAPDRLAGLAVGIKAALGKLSTSSLTFHFQRETAEALLSLLQSPPAQTSDGVRKALDVLRSNVAKLTHRNGCVSAASPDACGCGLGLAQIGLANLEKGLAALSRGEAGEPMCEMCGGRGEIGGFDRGDNAWRTERCPDCNPHHPEAGAPSREAIREQVIAILDPIAHSLPDFRQGNVNNGADQILALISSGGDHSSRAIPLSTISDGWRPTHRHVKRGTDYQVIGEARLQQAGQFGPNEGDRLTVYLGADGKLWARATSEFYDGRFEPLPASPDLSEGDR